MSFHPNDVVRRGRAASLIVCGVLVFLLSAFFRAQVLKQRSSGRCSRKTNRLRQIPTAAPRGMILDRNNKPIAENVVGYSVTLLAQNEDTLRATLTRLRGTLNLTNKQFEDAIRRYRRDTTRPTVILQDASFDVVSVLEEHRMEFPSLIIQSAPKRIYPDGQAVGAFVGYISEISEGELANLSSAGLQGGPARRQAGAGEAVREGAARARGRAVRRSRRAQPHRAERAGARGRHAAGRAAAVHEHRHRSAGVHRTACSPTRCRRRSSRWCRRRARCSRSTARRRSIPTASSAACRAPYYDSLRNDPRQPLYNKAVQGTVRARARRSSWRRR